VPSRFVPAVQRLALRTAGTPLARIWTPAYLAVRRLALVCLTGGSRCAAAYSRAGMAGEDFLPGLSDIDVAVVLAPDPNGPGVARANAERRWERARRALPVLGRLVDHPRIHEQPELDGIVGRSALTYGLEGGAAAYSGPAYAEDSVRMLQRPGLDGGAADWRLLHGPERRPPAPPIDAHERRIAAWLELVQWWQWAFDACAKPGPHTAHLCLKLIAEPARIWLALAHDERPAGRGAALDRALAVLPEEEDALRAAVELRRALPRSPAPPLRETLPAFARMTSRIAGVLSDQVRDAGAVDVRLVAGEPLPPYRWPWSPAPDLEGGEAPAAVALCDWRALARPGMPDDAFALLPGDPCDPDVLGAAAVAQRRGTYPALRTDGLLVLPAATHWRSSLRAVHCELTDPVSFALLAGATVARFRSVAGWSAYDCARRAVAEQRAAVVAATEPARELAALLCAGRAALFLESLEAGTPELAVTVGAAAELLAARAPVAAEAFAHYREYALRRVEPPRDVVAALRAHVMELESLHQPLRA
jgi:hypothetical protein